MKHAVWDWRDTNRKQINILISKSFRINFFFSFIYIYIIFNTFKQNLKVFINYVCEMNLFLNSSIHYATFLVFCLMDLCFTLVNKITVISVIFWDKKNICKFKYFNILKYSLYRIYLRIYCTLLQLFLS